MKHAYYIGKAYKEIVDRFQLELKYPTMREWLHPKHRIGVKSSYGSVFTSDVGDVSDAVVVKVNNKKHESDALRIEYDIQKHLNRLRPVTPNFALVLGRFKCAPIKSSAPEKMCSKDVAEADKVNYIIIEKVETTKNKTYTLNEVIQKSYLNTTDLIGIILQLCHGLQIAQDELRLTHFDLHGNNVLIQGIPDELGFPVNIQYPGGTVVAKAIAVITDFGLSRIHPKGAKPIHSIVKHKYGITNEFNPAYDIFLIIWEMHQEVMRAAKPKYRTFLVPLLTAMAQRNPRATGRTGRLMLTPDGKPETLRGMTPMDVVKMVKHLYPEAYQAATTPVPGAPSIPNKAMQTQYKNVSC